MKGFLRSKLSSTSEPSLSRKFLLTHAGMLILPFESTFTETDC